MLIYQVKLIYLVNVRLVSECRVQGVLKRPTNGLADRIRAQIRKAQEQYNWSEERAELFFKQEFERVLEQAGWASETFCGVPSTRLCPPSRRRR